MIRRLGPALPPRIASNGDGGETRLAWRLDVQPVAELIEGEVDGSWLPQPMPGFFLFDSEARWRTVRYWHEHGSVSNSPSLTQRRKEQAKLEISRCAAELFVLRGENPVTAEGIARAAGIGLRTFYRYFGRRKMR